MDERDNTARYMPKWLKAREELREGIASGDFGPEGSPFPPVRELAAKCGISLVTAQKVVTTLKEEGLIVQQGKGHVLRAGSVKKDAAPLVGVIATMPDNPFFYLLVKSIEAAASRRGMGILVAYSNYDVAKEGEILKLFAGKGVSGILACPADQNASSGNFAATKLPHVFIGRKIIGHEADTVLVQNFSAGQMVARHLLARGAKSFGYAGLSNFTSDPRLQGYRSTLAEAGFDFAPDALAFANNSDIDSITPKLERMLKSLPRPAGVFCFHDLLALRVLRLAAEMKIKVPEELTVVGFDNLPIAAETSPSLSSVAYPIEQMAETALSALEDIMGCRRHAASVSYLEPALIIRESSGGARPARRTMPVSADSIAYNLA